MLPCNHMFCYLCIKGVAARQKRCALCRSTIPPGYIDRPSVINKAEIKTTLKRSQDTGTNHWFYESKSGGWWLYEQRTSSEIEKVYSGGDKRTTEIRIAGFPYVIDFDEMVQYREDVPSRRRKIKRDVVKKETVKGVAGIYVTDSPRGRGEHVGRAEQIERSGVAHVDSGEEAGGEGVGTENDSSQTQSRLVTGFDS